MWYIAVSIPEFNSVSVSVSVILRWIFILIWLVITIRAILVPLYGLIHGYFSAKVIGIGEFALTLFIFGTLFFHFAFQLLILPYLRIYRTSHSYFSLF